MKLKNKTVYIIGCSSRLGKALSKLFKKLDIKHTFKDIKIYNDTDIEELIYRNFDPVSKDSRIMFNCIADTHGISGKTLQNKVNYEFPILLANFFKNDIVVNFGSITELTNLNTNYLENKRKVRSELKNTNSFYFMLGTLYGEYPLKEEMFLTELYNSIINEEDLIMTSGNQIREYHTYNDVANDIINVILNYNPGVYILSSNDGIKLKEIAIRAKNTFGSKIKINFKREANKNEVYENHKLKTYSKYCKTSIESILSFLNTCFKIDRG